MRSAAAVALSILFAHRAFAEPVKSITLHVERINCMVCAATVKKTLATVPGVKSVTVDAERKAAVVEFDPTKTNATELTASTQKRGFPASVRKQDP